MSHWETELSKFLSELSSAQQNTLSLLQRKGDLLAQSDTQGLSDLAEEENTALEKLQKLLKHREKLLQIAKAEGLPNDSIESLARHVDLESSGKALGEQCRQSVHQARLLQYQSLTNWVLTQRTLVHVSQVLDMISSKGKPRGIYNRRQNKEACTFGGVLLDVMSEK